MAYNPDRMDWYAARGPTCRGTLVVCHGLSEHRGRYAEWAGFMAARGWNLLTLDLPGHGAAAPRPGDPGAARWPDFESLLLEALRLAREAAGEAPVWLLGHSMGSFVATTAALRPDFPKDCAGVVLVGTDRPSRWQARALRLVSGMPVPGRRPTRPALLLETLVFGGYQRHFSRNRRGFDWISANPESVAAYRADPGCGQPPTLALWRVLAEGLYRLSQPELEVRWPARLPVLIVAGQDDPVGRFGRGPAQLARALKARGRSVELLLFPGLRHELLQPGNPVSTWHRVAQALEGDAQQAKGAGGQ